MFNENKEYAYTLNPVDPDEVVVTYDPKSGRKITLRGEESMMTPQQQQNQLRKWLMMKSKSRQPMKLMR
jgi:hypothetical protein